MTTAGDSQWDRCVIGIDVGGTKCAAGLVALPEGRVLARLLQPTRPERGGAAVLADVVELARALQRDAADRNVAPQAIGLAVAELVGIDGQVLSEATIGWKDRAVDETLRSGTGLPVRVDADVRAAARGEAYFGAGRKFQSFVYVTVGTGISASFVQDRVPYAGARGLTGTIASSRGLIPGDGGQLVEGPALEQFAAGPALATRFAAARPGFAGSTRDVVASAHAGDPLAVEIVASSGRAVGAVIAQLVNMLDPEAVVIGGGLGLVEGLYRETLESVMRSHIWSDLHRDIPICSAELQNDAVLVGAGLAAISL